MSSTHLRKAVLLSAMSVVLAAPAFAEVMDKEPTRTEIWAWAIGLALIGLLACRRHPALGLPSLVACLYSQTSIAIFDLHNPSIGPDIVREASRGYILSAYAAAALVLLGHAAGTWLYRRRKRFKRTRVVFGESSPL